jgi:protein arginine kinase
MMARIRSDKMWYPSYSKDADIILTSRVRLARNIEGMPFPHMLSKESASKVVDTVYSILKDNEDKRLSGLKLIKLSDITPLERVSMIERHLISSDLVNNYENSAVIINDEENISVMLNEEDHIRLQVIYPGFKLKEAYELANIIDDAIEGKITYAFDSNLGYLTSCPTNVGTGLRVSVMLHLPALTYMRNMNSILNTVTQVGMTIRGMYGEGSNITGGIYQISNQITLGLSEEEIINNLLAVTSKIVDQEKKMRNMILKKQKSEIDDDISRSLGLLKYAKILPCDECLNLISKVRMGIEMGLVDDIEAEKLNELIVNVQPATIQVIKNKEFDSKDMDIERAKIVREILG